MEKKCGYVLWMLLGVFLLAAGVFWRGTDIDGTTESVANLAAQHMEAPRVALTFDDGPNSEHTKTLLDGLKKRGVKASFFLMGKNIEGNEDLVKRMHDEGHLIGNHTFDHVQLNKLSDAQACDQITKTSNRIYEITGEYTTFIRPPFGEWKKDLDCVVTMIPVLWDIDPLDWKTDNVDQVVSRVEKDVEDGDIILLHDNYASSVEAALRIVDDLSKQGYRFVTAEELLFD